MALYKTRFGSRSPDETGPDRNKIPLNRRVGDLDQTHNGRQLCVLNIAFVFSTNHVEEYESSHDAAPVPPHVAAEAQEILVFEETKEAVSSESGFKLRSMQ